MQQTVVNTRAPDGAKKKLLSRMPSKVEKRGGFEESGPEENERIQYFEGAENPVMMTRFELSRGIQ